MRLIDADSIPWDVDGVGEIPVITKEEINAMPTVDAVPIEFIQKEIKELEESLDYYGSIGEYDALRIDAMYQHDALTGLLRHWKAERKDNE